MKPLSQAVEFDPDLLRKYDRPLPRYTSYPPATQLKEEFEEIDFRAAIAVGNRKKTPLSLYCHILLTNPLLLNYGGMFFCLTQ
jgi:oxygen-independent coproporphyrinogen III oxidase